VLARSISTGNQYRDRYPTATTIQVVLYERPELENAPRSYGDLLALRDALVPEQLHAGDRLHVDLWWSAQQIPPLDYSVGVYLMKLDEDVVVAQHDGPPGTLPTSQWTTDSLIFDRHMLRLPDDLAPGIYRIAVSVYWYGDHQPLTVDGADYAVVGQVEVH
jgi:hypothetical protein